MRRASSRGSAIRFDTNNFEAAPNVNTLIDKRRAASRGFGEARGATGSLAGRRLAAALPAAGSAGSAADPARQPSRTACEW